jgi:hypothetical protein
VVHVRVLDAKKKPKSAFREDHRYDIAPRTSQDLAAVASLEDSGCTIDFPFGLALLAGGWEPWVENEWRVDSIVA